MTPLASAVVLFALAIAVIALFAVRMHRAASRDAAATLPHPAPAAKPAALEGALAAGD
jgi:hypothetical protein